VVVVFIKEKIQTMIAVVATKNLQLAKILQQLGIPYAPRRWQEKGNEVAYANLFF
jgi:hypothetical protein